VAPRSGKMSWPMREGLLENDYIVCVMLFIQPHAVRSRINFASHREMKPDFSTLAAAHHKLDSFVRQHGILSFFSHLDNVFCV
jgi:hypothetical protein